MMKKEEIISLGLATGAVISMLIGLSLNYGVWRTVLVVLSCVLLLLSMGAFKQGDPNRMEKILRIVFFSAFSLMVLFSLVYTGFADDHDGWKYLLLVALLLVVSGFFALGKGWLNMRVSWLDVTSPSASKEGRVLTGNNLDDVKGIFLISQEDFEKIFKADDERKTLN